MERYAIAGGLSSGGSSLPVIITPDTSTSYAIPALPTNTYYFRVYAVGAGAPGPSSASVPVTVNTGPSVPGPPTALQSSISGADVTLGWAAPSIGGPPTAYQVEFGTAPGRNDLAIVNAAGRPRSR